MSQLEGRHNKTEDAGKHTVSPNVWVFTPQNPCSTFLPLGHLHAEKKTKKRPPWTKQTPGLCSESLLVLPSFEKSLNNALVIDL